MGRYITKEVEVDFEIEVDDVIEFISMARPKELKQIKEAIKDELKDFGEYVEGKALNICVPSSCHANDLIAADQLQELIARLGIEEALNRLQA